MTRRKKVNSRLKQLAETRARASANVERLIVSMANTAGKIKEVQALIDELKAQYFDIEHNLTEHHNVIRFVDKAIREEFPEVNPNKIPSTYGFRSEYGRRGNLREKIRDILKEAGDAGLTLKELGLKVSAEFKMVHHTPEELRRWINNSIEPALKRMSQGNAQVKKIPVPGTYPRWVLNKTSYSWEDLENLETPYPG